MGNLYIIATPIGNLEDITLRAIRMLKEVDLILCEDTRVTKRLLTHYNIQIKQISIFNDQKSGLKPERVIELLKEGKSIALVTDAGTPAISDPGSLLVNKIRQLDWGGQTSPKVIPIPGASALTTAFSGSGILGGEFIFLGFLPHKKGRETLFKEIGSGERTYVFYESPHRIMKTLESLVKFAPNRKVMIARELTKIFEQFLRGTPEELHHILEEDKNKQRGEFVVMVFDAYNDREKLTKEETYD